ncbi:MAG TPA: hypothetical protein VIG99_21805 [Myxococcaceae bacterium]|jgi:hypothetical protein
MSERLSHDTVPVQALTAVDRTDMLALMERCYEGVVPERFAADLAGKQHVIMLRDVGSRALAGFSTIALREEPHHGRPARVLYSGDTVIHPDYWGQKVLEMAFGRFLVRQKLRRPWAPLYWLLLSGGFKTYLMLVRNFASCLPQRGEVASPTESAFLDAVCRRWFGDEYDPAQGTVRMKRHYRVRSGLCPVDARALANPDIAYFVERNPGHADGSELACLARVQLSDVARAFARIARRRLAGSGRRSSSPFGEGIET